MYKRLYQALTLFVFIVLFAACKKDATGNNNNPPPPPAGKAITIEGFAFAPGSLTIPKGTVVTFTNKDAAPHTATANDGSFDTGSIAKDGTAKITFNTAGTFTYFCTFHPGMTGTIIVSP